MTDTVDKDVRSKIMSRIRGKDTLPEKDFRKKLWNQGFRYRKNFSIGRYNADIAFPSRMTVILIDGCFWHGCPKHFRMPKSNVRYWKKKIKTNIIRDKKAVEHMETAGWRVIRFWEHQVKETPKSCISTVKKALRQ